MIVYLKLSVKWITGNIREGNYASNRSMRSWFRGCVRSHPPIVSNHESRSGGLSMYDAAKAFDARPRDFSSRFTVAWDASSFSSAEARSAPAPNG